MAPPLILRYQGEGEFSPAGSKMAQIADEHFVIGERYKMVEHYDRSINSHRHFFAQVNRAGYADERSIVCGSKAEAQRVASFIKPIDDYSIVVARECVVTIYSAKSQSFKAMGRKDFQASKAAVLEFIDSLLGLEPGTTKQQTGKAA